MNKSQNGYVSSIESETLKNEFFRKVLFTSSNMQIVAMTLKKVEDIGLEIHNGHDQFFKIVQGNATVIMNKESNELVENDVAIVPSGVEHNIVNNGETALKLYTIYSPPEHADGRIDETKP